jgi:hypothetical protein
MLYDREYVSSTDKRLYFPFITEFLNQYKPGENNDEASLYSTLCDISEKEEFFGEDSAHLRKFAMGLRTYAPAVQAYFQYYLEDVVPFYQKTTDFDPNCSAWLVHKNKQICDPSELPK